jgi:hypothetical protein
VQWDTSIHDWLEGRSREPVKLIAMIDDASNELLARFVAEDATAEHMRVLRSYLEQYGRPLAFYTDKAGLFRVNARQKGYGEERTAAGESQIGRALRELGVELIHAHSPQAKGRVERCFGTLQDRLVKGLRKAGVKSLAEANRYLETTFLTEWQKRFRREPASDVDAHRPLGRHAELESILSHVESRHVTNNYTVSWEGNAYQIPREAIGPGLRSSRVRVERRLDGTVWARVGQLAVELQVCETTLPEMNTKTPAEVRRDHNRGGRSEWMNDFHLKQQLPGRAMAQAAKQAG